VLAVDPLSFGESEMGRNYLHSLMLATVGERALGIEAGQLAAVARWAAGQFKGAPSVNTIGPRSSLVALVAAAMEKQPIGDLKPTQQLESLHDILKNNWTILEYPEMFCFGLLESFDVPRLKELATKAE
jgi:hypothetical protein